MPTPAEKKALLFAGAVALLGGGVRLWTSRHPAHEDDGGTEAAERPQGGSKGGGAGRSSHNGKGTQHGGTGGYSRSGGTKTPKRHNNATDAFDPTLSTTVDLDLATADQIDALGVLQPGIARMIVANRDQLGPFGAIQELERVPYLTRASIQKLAPRVTFSRPPRPKNAVLGGASEPPPVASTPHRPARTSRRRRDSS